MLNKLIFLLVIVAQQHVLAAEPNAVADVVPLPDKPRIEFSVDQVVLTDAVRSYLAKAGITDYGMFPHSPVWREKISLRGTFTPAEFFAKLRQTYGVVAHNDPRLGGSLSITDMMGPLERTVRHYLFRGMLEIEGRRAAESGSPGGRKSFEGKIAEAMRDASESEPKEPPPEVHYSDQLDGVMVEALPEQHARLVAYIATVDRPPHRFSIWVQDHAGRTVFFGSPVAEAGPQYKSEREEGVEFEIGVTASLKSEKPSRVIRLKGYIGLNGEKIAFDTEASPDGTALLLERGPLRYTARVAIID